MWNIFLKESDTVSNKKQELVLGFFSGFYESIHNDVFEREEEYIMEDYGKTWDDFKWDYDYISYCKSYVSAISRAIGIKLEFVEMTSPREYNFSTDHIYCKISKADVKKISSVLNSDTLREIIKKRFTSRSGFMSFYSNSLDEWNEKPVSEWDYNELGTLLDAWIIENNSLEYWESLDFYGYDYCLGNGQYVSFEKLWDEKAELEEKEFHQKELEKLESWKNSVNNWQKKSEGDLQIYS